MTPRISASSYSNTAPLIWSFLYGSNHGKVELVLDNAPARSAELLAQDRVDAALVPVIASQFIDGVKVVPNICVGAKQKVRSVCLVTKREGLENVRSVSLDISSRTSVALTKIIFREFLGFEPEWRDASPDLDAMLSGSDCALLIGDPALLLSEPPVVTGGSTYRKFDLAELWHQYTGLGFVFAMWMTRKEKIEIDLAAAREEGLMHIDEISANYAPHLGMEHLEMVAYLTRNVRYDIDDKMFSGMELYFELAAKHRLLPAKKMLEFTTG